MDITSPQNPHIKQIVKLREDKRQRQRLGLMIVEGFAEIRLALRAGFEPQTLLRAPDLAVGDMPAIQAECLTVARIPFGKISRRDNPDGWLGVFRIPGSDLAALRLSPSPLLVIAETIEKPGNLGAILRTADAAGVEAVLVCDPRVDLWNPNVIRASRGTVFSVKTATLDNSTAFDWLKAQGIRIAAALPDGSLAYTEADLSGPLAIVLGTEDKGLSEFWISRADYRLRIPMTGLINSLNVSTAAAILIYESLRQRGVPGANPPD